MYEIWKFQTSNDTNNFHSERKVIILFSLYNIPKKFQTPPPTQEESTIH